MGSETTSNFPKVMYIEPELKLKSPIGEPGLDLPGGDGEADMVGRWYRVRPFLLIPRSLLLSIGLQPAVLLVT